MAVDRPRLKRVLRTLEDQYGKPRTFPAVTYIEDVLVSVLSRGMAVSKARAVVSAVRDRYVDWNEARLAQEYDIALAGKGLSIRGDEWPTILRETLLRIWEERHELDLGGMDHVVPRERIAFLENVETAGRWTGMLVVRNRLGAAEAQQLTMEAGMSRVAQRVGLIDETKSPNQAQESLQALMPQDKDQALGFHVHLCRLGQETCTTKRPHCPECPVLQECRTGKMLA